MLHAIKTQPVAEPVTLAEMRGHLGISQAEDTARDSIITGRIISARQWSENYTRTAYITQTWTGYAADFPCRHGLKATHEPAHNKIALKMPLQSVTHVKFLDTDGVQQTLDSSLYQVDPVTGCVVPAHGQTWPSVRVQLNAVQVEYICGYGTADAVPESIKDAIRFIVGQWEVFQSSIEGVVRPFTIPNAAKQLLDNYIDMREFF